VTLVLGNHDGTLTAADVVELSATVGEIRLVDPPHVLLGTSGARTAFAHGHASTMFNAPDERSRFKPLPVGHFVTRAFAYQMAEKLKPLPGQTVADLPGMGSPNGFDLTQFLHSFVATLDPDVARMLLDYVMTVSGMPHDLPIVLPDGTTTTMDEAKSDYADLFTRWVAAEGGETHNAARAARADQHGETLSWFAQRLAQQTCSDLVVMGHTHGPVGGMTVAPANYINTGFECPSAPDMPPKAFTFASVDLEHAAAHLLQVAKTNGGYQVVPASAPTVPVAEPPAVDMSCYVRVENMTSKPLMRAVVPAPDAGYWVVEPPRTIPAGGRGDMWLQDRAGTEGSEGGVTYTSGGNSLEFTFACPTTSFNAASGAGDDFVAKTGSGDWQQGSVPWTGRPLQVRFSVR
jgi:hypothetical protein